MLFTRRFLSLCPALLLTLVGAQSASAAETSARFTPVKAFADQRLAQIERQFTETNRANVARGTFFAYSRSLRIDPVTPWPWSARKDRAVLRDAIRFILTGYAAPEELKISGPISKNSESTFRRLDSMLYPVWNEQLRNSFIPVAATTLRDSGDSIRLYEGTESNSFGYGSFLMITDVVNREILVLGMQYAE